MARCAFYFNDYEIADPSALVNRVYRLMSKELGVDPDTPLEEDAHDKRGYWRVAPCRTAMVCDDLVLPSVFKTGNSCYEFASIGARRPIGSR